MDDAAPTVRPESDGLPAPQQEQVAPQRRGTVRRQFFKAKATYTKPTKERLAMGVRRDRSGSLEVRIRVNGRLVQKVFPAGTHVQTATAWRDHVRHENPRHRRIPQFLRPLPPCLNGFCYVYFVLQGSAVKIGRATNVARRVEELQTASPTKLTLLAAVGAHHSLEAELIKRFEPFRLNGEWFIYGAEIDQYVRRLQEGWNPVEALFDWNQSLFPDGIVDSKEDNQ